MQVTATLRRAMVSPQKARLIADLIRGKGINEAVSILEFSPQKSAKIFKKLLLSAVANAEDRMDQFDDYINIDDLKVSTVFVNEGMRLKRIMPRAKGRADRIVKRTSHVTIKVSV
ncbi:MAG: 50S ribosomal protein L22 [Pseudomonadota bacterium]|nr:50S ribosomal protein L22 [Gammaproteobacteria bacterium]MEC8012493.1 50S ribosomal protein L22 [Pseudomonadota bacterium]HBF07923.1 50S ribosomal protein L22 [Gammaproteobacteria bacterium]|tara:strand:+ start:4554 stop:4898 length:345 start_codon:yes stop_codon:yes gene_type:complete